jgi:hypothetical protein
MVDESFSVKLNIEWGKPARKKSSCINTQKDDRNHNET